MRWSLWLLLCAAGCGGAVEPSPAPWVEVGTGLDELRVLRDGDPLEIVFGPQGGWHVDLGVRFAGLSPEGLVVTYRLREDAVDIGYPVKRFLRAGDVHDLGDGRYERFGDRVILSVDADEVVGRTLYAEAEIIAGGTVIAEAASVLLVDEEP